MQNDLFLVIGVLILLFAIPAIVSALSDNHAPRAAAVMVLIGGGLVAIALVMQQGGYGLTDIPRAFVRVIGHYFL